MAPLPSNTTGVVFVDYTVGGEEHTIQCRYSASGSAAGAMTVIADFLAALTSVLETITITGARHRPAGSTITLPMVWTGAATYGSGVATRAQSAWYYDFIGRSPDGRRVRMSVFGANAMTDIAEGDYRIPIVGAFIGAKAVLDAAPDDAVTISGDTPVWYTYANTGVNAYWRNRIR